MSILQPIRDLIRKLDSEGGAELQRFERDLQGKLQQVTPILESLGLELKGVVTDAAEQAVPGLRSALEDAVTAAEAKFRQLFELP